MVNSHLISDLVKVAISKMEGGGRSVTIAKSKFERALQTKAKQLKRSERLGFFNVLNVT